MQRPYQIVWHLKQKKLYGLFLWMGFYWLNTNHKMCVFDKVHIDMGKTCLRYMKETKNIVTSNWISK